MPGGEIKSSEVTHTSSPSKRKGIGLPLSFEKARLAEREPAKRKQEDTRKEDRKRQKVSDKNKTHTIEELKEAITRQSDENARLEKQVEQAGNSQFSELPTYALQPITKLIAWTAEGQQLQQQADLAQRLQQQADLAQRLQQQADLAQRLQQQAIIKSVSDPNKFSPKTPQEVSRGAERKALGNITNISHDDTEHRNMVKDTIIKKTDANNIQTNEISVNQKRGIKIKVSEFDEEIANELIRIKVDYGDSPEVREKKMEAEVKQTREKQK